MTTTTTEAARRPLNLSEDPREWPDEELAAMTEAELERWVDIESAASGVALLPPDPGPRPTVELPEPEQVVFHVSFGYSTVGTFRSESDATALQGALTKAADNAVTIGSSGDSKYVRGDRRPDRETKVAREHVYSETQWASIEKDHARFEERLELWEERKTEYDDANRERDAIEVDLRGAIADASARLAAAERARFELDRYLDLAEGVREVALVFMHSAQPDMVRTLGLEEEAIAAREPTLDQTHGRLLKRRVAQVRRLVGDDEEETE